MRRTYPSDLLDEEWALVAHLFEGQTYGFKPKYPRREMLDAIFYVVRTGCQWRNLPHDFPPWQTVYNTFRNWQLKGIFQKVNEELRNRLRLKEGKAKEASGAIIDSQTAKTTEKGGSARDTMGPKKSKEEKDTSLLIPRGFYYKLKLLQAMSAIRKG